MTAEILVGLSRISLAGIHFSNDALPCTTSSQKSIKMDFVKLVWISKAIDAGREVHLDHHELHVGPKFHVHEVRKCMDLPHLEGICRLHPYLSIEPPEHLAIDSTSGMYLNLASNSKG